MYSFQKAKRLDLQSDVSLTILNMAKNTFISDLKSSMFLGKPFLFSNARLEATLLDNFTLFNFSSRSVHPWQAKELMPH